MSMSRYVTAIASAAILACLLTACATATAAAPADDGERLAPSFAALAQQYLNEGAMSDWDRAVVEKAARTGRISQADYDEGADNFEACMIAGGERWVRTRHLNGVVEFQPPHESSSSDAESENQLRVQGQCYSSGYLVTQELFAIQQVNPDLLSNFSLVALKCLKSAGVVDEDFPLDEYESAMGPHLIPVEYPFDVMDPRSQTCLWSTGSAVSVNGG
ncbi:MULTISPECIES: hypothetical protein [Microbacterium]|uniref:hypothetical protein n=1 Tax=Microbacterium TaxID=33882 RepID=UPI0027875791|nr:MULTISPECIES: hypothetical protein [Microbacterium]MDQ1074515.1 hypothetical protein [Microbacterium sp. SORGH_AS_0969]MDQ1114744.1 hypothetical protein [Microbacterium testaceum]